MTKICKKCGIEKAEEFFRPHHTGRGTRGTCRECERSYRLEHYKKNPEKFAAASRKWSKENPERRNATKKKWRDRNPEKQAAISRKSVYGISQIEFENLFKSQNGKCAICDFQFPSMVTGDRTQSPHLDHCHSSGKIRGLLCLPCNSLLGKAKDSSDILQKAIQYLQKSSS